MSRNSSPECLSGHPMTPWGGGAEAPTSEKEEVTFCRKDINFRKRNGVRTQPFLNVGMVLLDYSGRHVFWLSKVEGEIKMIRGGAKHSLQNHPCPMFRLVELTNYKKSKPPKHCFMCMPASGAKYRQGNRCSKTQSYEVMKEKKNISSQTGSSVWGNDMHLS